MTEPTNFDELRAAFLEVALLHAEVYGHDTVLITRVVNQLVDSIEYVYNGELEQLSPLEVLYGQRLLGWLEDCNYRQQVMHALHGTTIQ